MLFVLNEVIIPFSNEFSMFTVSFSFTKSIRNDKLIVLLGHCVHPLFLYVFLERNMVLTLSTQDRHIGTDQYRIRSRMK